MAHTLTVTQEIAQAWSMDDAEKLFIDKFSSAWMKAESRQRIALDRIYSAYVQGGDYVTATRRLIAYAQRQS